MVSAVEHLFDDAGLFPPAGRPMAEAMRAHTAALAGPHARMVGPFLCPVSRLDELDACVAAGLHRPPEVGVIAYDLSRGGRRPGVVRGLVQFEAPLGTRLPDLGGQVRRYFEIPRHGKVHEALDAVLVAGTRVKLRCGGVSRDHVPSCERVADVLVGCAERGLMLKATTGLHQPFRADHPSGPRHGFLNVLAAAGLARRGGSRPDVAALLALDESAADTLVANLARGRELLASVGARSVDEPVAALRAHGLL